MLPTELNNFFKNKVVLCIGGAGSIGSAIVRVLSELQPKLLIILDQDESSLFDIYEEVKDKCNVDYVVANIREEEVMEDVFHKYKPTIVYHAAALKHVVLTEKYPSEATKTNVIGTQNVIAAAIHNDVQKFVLISSDKAVKPMTAMGITKEAGEHMCLDMSVKYPDIDFIIVRFGNVMPSRGSVVPVFKKQIEEGRNLTVTHPEMRRYFMGIYEAANLVLKSTILGNSGEIAVLDMGESILISDLAKMMIKLSGKNLQVIYTKPHEKEKFQEVLFTAEEKERAEKREGIWFISSRPQGQELNKKASQKSSK